MRIIAVGGESDKENAAKGRLKSRGTVFQTASSPSAYVEPDVGCVAPRRRTRSLPNIESLSSLQIRNRVRGCATHPT